MITLCSVTRKNSVVFIIWVSGQSYYLKWEEAICNDSCRPPAYKSHTPAHKARFTLEPNWFSDKKYRFSCVNLRLRSPSLVIYSKLWASSTHFRKVILPQMRFGLHNPAVKQNELSGFAMKGKWIVRPSPGLLQGWGVRDPAFPKSTLVPEMRWTDPKPTHNMLETHPARDWVL